MIKIINKYYIIYSLRNVKLQHELWSHIQVKLAEIDGVQDKKKWEAVVDLFRKLREGVFSSQWSRGDFKFANQGKDCNGWLDNGNR